MGSENNNFVKGEIGTEADKGKHCNTKVILKDHYSLVKNPPLH